MASGIRLSSVLFGAGMVLVLFPCSCSAFAEPDQNKKLIVMVEDQDGNPVHRYPVDLLYEDVSEGMHSPATFNLTAGTTYKLYVAMQHGDYSFDRWKESDSVNSTENTRTFSITENDGDMKLTAVIKKEGNNSAREASRWQGTVHDIKIGDTIYFLSYRTSGGAYVSSMLMDNKTQTLSIYLSNTTFSDDGQLIIELPRNVFDSRQNETMKKEFIVTVSNQTVKDAPPKRFGESYSTQSMRMLAVHFYNGTELVQIKGTHVAPEFGSLTSIIASVLGITFAVRRIMQRG